MLCRLKLSRRILLSIRWQTNISRGDRSVNSLGETVSCLRTPTSTIYLVGTCHVSQASADEVTRLVRKYRPQTVMVELCRARADRLMAGVTEEAEARQFMSKLVQQSNIGAALSNPVLTMIEKAGTAGGMFSKALSGFALPPAFSNLPPNFGTQFALIKTNLQQVVRYFQGQDGEGPPWFQAFLKSLYKLLRAFGLTSGAEFKAAIKEAKAAEARVVLGDREGDETVKRISKAISPQEFLAMAQKQQSNTQRMEKLKSLFTAAGSIETMIESLKTREAAREMIEEMKDSLPKLHDVLVVERDDILCENLLRCPGSTIVAVVGLAHMDGIEKRFLDNIPASSTPPEYY